MIKALLIPFFSFGAMKLLLTLAITYKSLNWLAISCLIILIVINIYILVQLIRGKSIFPKNIKSKLSTVAYEKDTR